LRKCRETVTPSGTFQICSPLIVIIPSNRKPLRYPLVKRASTAPMKKGRKAGISLDHMIFSFLFLQVEFLPVIVIFVTHQKGPHPFGHKHQNDATDETVYRVKTQQPLPVMVGVTVNDKIENKQYNTACIEKVENQLDVLRLVKKMLSVLRHIIVLYLKNCQS
jgi:hypothetical protein